MINHARRLEAPSPVDAEREEAERLAKWLEESPSTLPGERFKLMDLPLEVRMDLRLTANLTNNDPKAVLERLRLHYPHLSDTPPSVEARGSSR
jgi:hypothetical protein